MRALAAIALLAIALASADAASPTALPPQTAAPSGKSVEAIALQWFERMRTGLIDRTQLTAQYSAQLSDDAVKKMSAYIRTYQYGASPIGARVLRTRMIGQQTFYDVKLLFPRGDAAGLLLGFNEEGKITGLALTAMAGD